MSCFSSNKHFSALDFPTSIEKNPIDKHFTRSARLEFIKITLEFSKGTMILGSISICSIIIVESLEQSSRPISVYV